MMREKSGFDDGGRWKKKTVTTESIYSLAPKGRSEISRSEKENRVHFGKGNKSGESGNFGTRCASYPETGGHVLMPFFDTSETTSIGQSRRGKYRILPRGRNRIRASSRESENAGRDFSRRFPILSWAAR